MPVKSGLFTEEHKLASNLYQSKLKKLGSKNFKQVIGRFFQMYTA